MPLSSNEKVTPFLKILHQFKSKSRAEADFHKKLKNSVLLVGDGRSGTSWVTNIVNHNEDFICSYEPFHPNKGACRDWGMFKYIRPDSKERSCLKIASEIITGNKNKDNLFIAKKRLIKSIFAHLFLKWIQVNSPGIRIVLLLRHPCAVANSKQRTKSWGWLENPRDFLNQKELIDDFLSPFVEVIKAADTYFKKQIVIWSVVNWVPLQQFKEGEIHLAFYENFITSPEEEIQRLFNFIGDDTEKPILNEKILKALKEPVSLRRDSPISRGKDLLDDWRHDVTDEQLNSALKILKSFGLDKIYGQGSTPNMAEAYKLLEK